MKKLKKVLIVFLCVLMVVPMTGCSLFGKGDTDKFVLDRTFDAPGQNDDFMYNVYGNYIGISKYIGQNTDVVIPATIRVPVTDKEYPVLVIEKEAFKEVDYGSEVNNVNITSVTLPDGLLEIESNAFANCKSLATINIPMSVTAMGSSIFSGCASLISINVPPMLNSVPQGYCKGCTNLLTIVFDEGTELYPLSSKRVIESYAFSGCSSLRVVNIPDEFVTINSMAFYNCRSLTGVTVLNTVKTIGRDAFGNASDSLTIRGYRKSAIAKYCSKNFIKFALIDESEGLDTSNINATNEQENTSKNSSTVSTGDKGE